jgi:hypothetical protein
MTHERDIERILDRWFADGAESAPGRVIDDVADRIERQSQLPAWRLQWRNSTVDAYSKIAVAAAAVLILAVVGYNLLPSNPSGVGGPTATASPSPTPSPTAAPSPRSISSVTFKPALRLEAPAEWVSTDGDQAFVLEAPAGAGSIEFRNHPVVGSNDSNCEGLAAAGIGASVDEIVAALSGDPRLSVTSVGTVAVGDLEGQAMDIQVAPDWTGTCQWSGGKPAAVVLTVADPPGPWIGVQEPERLRVIFLDVGGSVVSITVGSSAGSGFDAFVTQAMPIIESARFTP